MVAPSERDPVFARVKPRSVGPPIDSHRRVPDRSRPAVVGAPVDDPLDPSPGAARSENTRGSLFPRRRARRRRVRRRRSGSPGPTSRRRSRCGGPGPPRCPRPRSGPPRTGIRPPSPVRSPRSSSRHRADRSDGSKRRRSITGSPGNGSARSRDRPGVRPGSDRGGVASSALVRSPVESPSALPRPGRHGVPRAQEGVRRGSRAVPVAGGTTRGKRQYGRDGFPRRCATGSRIGPV